jgi:hypothetical protein
MPFLFILLFHLEVIFDTSATWETDMKLPGDKVVTSLESSKLGT